MAYSSSDLVAKYQAIRDGYIDALLADAVSGPQPDYSLDGQSVSRDKWRESLQKLIDTYNESIIRLQPFQKKTVSR